MPGADEKTEESREVLDVFVSLSRLVDGASSYEEILSGTTDILHGWCRGPSAALIRFGGREYSSGDGEMEGVRYSSPITVHGVSSGEISLLLPRAEDAKDPFHRFVPRLLEAVAERLGKVAARLSAEAAAEERKQRYFDLFEHMADGVAVYRAVDEGEGFLFVEFNRAAERIDRRRREDVIGKRLDEVFPGAEGYRLYNAIRSVWKTGEPEKVPLWEFSDEKTSGWRENHLYRLPSGEVVSIFRDLTREKGATDALKLSEARFQELTELLPIPVYEAEMNGRLTFINQKGLEIFGYTKEEAEGGFAIFEAIAEEDRAMAVENVKKILAGSPKTGHEYSLIRKDGSRFYGMIYSAPIMRAVAPAGIRGVVIETTERRMAEDALRESEKKYRMLFNKANDALYLHEFSPGGGPGHFLDVNDVACDMTGYSREELLSMNVDQINDPEYPGDPGAFTRELAETSHAFHEWSHLARNGRKIPVEISTHLFEMEGREVALSVVRDITVRLREEEERHRVERRFARITEYLPLPLLILDGHGNPEYANPAFSDLFGSTEEVFSDLRKLFERAYPDHSSADLSSYSPDAPHAGPFRMRCREGSERDILFRLVSVDETQMFLLCEDMTERLRAEEVLRRSRDTLRTILDSTPFGIAIIGKDRKIRSVNLAAAALMGYDSPEEVEGKICYEALCNTEAYRCPIFDLGQTTDRSERILKTRDGTEIPILKSAAPINLWGEDVLLETFIDITEQKESREREARALRRIEDNISKLTILNDEIRNPLAIIVGLADLEGGVLAEKIKGQADIIDHIINELDQGWLESEKIREFLRKHYLFDEAGE